MDEKDSRFDDRLPAAPPPSPLRASNTLETLRPREVAGYQTPSGGHVTLEEVLAPEKALQHGINKQFNDIAKVLRDPETQKYLNANGKYVDWEEFNATFDFVRKTDYDGPVPKSSAFPYEPGGGGANALPVNWPASTNKPPKPVILPSVYDRVTKLEEQVDSLLDRLAKFSIRSSHKI